jgi:hypothetical protein
MNRQTLVVALAAILVVGGAVGAILWSTRKNVVAVSGEITRVRTHAIDEQNSIAIIDLKITNPSDQYFGVRDVDVKLETADGKTPEPMVVSEIDAQRLFNYYPQLGPKNARSLIIRDRIRAGETAERMLAVSFPVSARAIGDRKSLRLIVTETDGRKSEIIEQRR